MGEKKKEPEEVELEELSDEEFKKRLRSLVKKKKKKPDMDEAQYEGAKKIRR